MVAPSAPAPTDVSVTITHSTAPARTVRAGCQRRKRCAVSASHRAIGRLDAASEQRGNRRQQQHDAERIHDQAALDLDGIRPKHEPGGDERGRHAAVAEAPHDLADRCRPCGDGSIRRPLFVIAANQRSVPTAVVGATPKRRISAGAISEPPPTPVIPTIRPTSNPATACSRSIRPHPPIPAVAGHRIANQPLLEPDR